MKAPDVYFDQHTAKYVHERRNEDDIEYVRKDAFIEKALAYLNGKLYSTICGSEQNVVAYVGYGEYGKDGDKVKVIVIKED